MHTGSITEPATGGRQATGGGGGTGAGTALHHEQRARAAQPLNEVCCQQILTGSSHSCVPSAEQRPGHVRTSGTWAAIALLALALLPVAPGLCRAPSVSHPARGHCTLRSRCCSSSSSARVCRREARCGAHVVVLPSEHWPAPRIAGALCTLSTPQCSAAKGCTRSLPAPAPSHLPPTNHPL